MKTGMTSVTFRAKSISAIVDIAKKADICSIEWGGDVHCPPNDENRLTEAARMTAENGLVISSYGSYFRLGVSLLSEFEDICRAAKILGTNTVRIWAYNKEPLEVSKEEYEKCIKDAKAVADTAKKYGITVCFEYHRHTLTLNAESAVKLMQDINKNNMRLYWQPNPDITHDENCAELRKVLPYVINIHCFHWVNMPEKPQERFSLSSGINEWKRYIEIAKDKPKYIILEFVKDDDDSAFLADADTLKSMI